MRIGNCAATVILRSFSKKESPIQHPNQSVPAQEHGIFLAPPAPNQGRFLVPGQIGAYNAARLPHYFDVGITLEILPESSQVAAAVGAAATECVARIDQAIAGAELASRPPALNVESLTGMKELRDSRRRVAEGIMEANMQLLCAGEYDRVPLEADAGGTARKLVAVGRAFGKDGPEYQAVWGALLRDSGRRIAEAESKNDKELFEETEMTYDEPSKQFFSDALSVDEMLENGLTPATNPHCPEEGPRRINEDVEIKTDGALVTIPEMADYGSYSFSQCPQSLIDRYARDPESGGYSDYVPENEKAMLRAKRYDPKTGKLYMQQMAVSGKYINNKVFNRVLQEFRATDGWRLLDRTEVHGTQVLIRRDVIANVIGMLRRLDEIASDYHGIKIFWGMPLQPGQQADYEGIEAAAANRRRQQADLTERYARYLLELEESGLDRELVNREADAFLKAELLKIAKADPTKAEVMFDVKTAEGMRQVNRLESEGRFLEAQRLLAQVEQAAPDPGGCGAGSCGLENLSAAEEKGTKELLGVGSDEKTAKDTERPCTKCGQKSVVYVWNSMIRKKGCLDCKATEIVKLGKTTQKSNVTFTLQRPKTKEVVTLGRRSDQRLAAA